MPLTLPQKPKTLAQELTEKAQNVTKGRDLAAVYEIADTPSVSFVDSSLKREPEDNKLGDALFRGIVSSTLDAQSSNHSPYLQPTNSAAIKELGKLGVDTSKIDREFFERNAWLKQYAQSGMNGVPLRMP